SPPPVEADAPSASLRRCTVRRVGCRRGHLCPRDHTAQRIGAERRRHRDGVPPSEGPVPRSRSAVTATHPLNDATVAITGGTGSFGKTMVKHLLTRGVGRIHILSRD